MTWFKRKLPKHVIIVAAVAIAAPFAHTYYASAFQKEFGTCNGSNVIWRETIAIHRNSCSINNTTTIAAYFNGAGQWDNPSNLAFNFLVNSASDCSFDRASNGENEVSLVNRSAIDGNNGLTFTDIGLCGIGSNDIDEADTTVANDMDFVAREGNNTNPNYGRSTFVHELGHFIGLDHVSRTHAVMDGVGSAALTGGNEPATIWTDDELGLNTLYGLTGSAKSNLIVSAQQWVNGVQNLNSGVLHVCRGGSVSPSFYLGNSGNLATGTYNLRVRLSTTAPFSGGYTQSTNVAATYTHAINAFSEVITQLPFTVPSTLPLTSTPYFIYVDLDFTGSIGERNEGDNTTVSGLQLRVDC